MQLRITVDRSNWSSHDFHCRVHFTISLLILTESLLFYAHDVLNAVFFLAMLQYVRAFGKHNIYFNLTILQSLQSNSVDGLYCFVADAVCTAVVKLTRCPLFGCDAESGWQQCPSCLCVRNKRHSFSLYLYKWILFPLPPPLLPAHTHVHQWVGWYFNVKKCAIWKKEHLDAVSSSFSQQGLNTAWGEVV